MDVSTFKHFALRKTNSFFYSFQIVMRLGMGIGMGIRDEEMGMGMERYHAPLLEVEIENLYLQPFS